MKTVKKQQNKQKTIIITNNKTKYKYSKSESLSKKGKQTISKRN